MIYLRIILFAAISIAAGCVSPPVADYEKFYAASPFTVVVPPVRNETADAEAPRYFLSTITHPLANRGYYVIPVQATADILIAEGIIDGGALDSVPPARFRDYFGADAVLYITLKSWDTVYAILASSVTVAMHYRLVSTVTGETLWETNRAEVLQSQGGSGGHPIAILITAAVNAAVTATASDYVPMAMIANTNACATLPAGPYNLRFEAEKRSHLARHKRKKASGR
jgi:hypothetical protein